MPAQDDENDWPARLTRVIAREIQRHRKAQRMSVQQLSDAAERLGVTIQRPVLSNLENGRRNTISVAELLVLAQALNVPPLQLVFPAGYTEQVEALPGVEVEPLTAVHWARGQEPLSGDGAERQKFLGWLYAFEEHEHLVHALLDTYRVSPIPTRGSAEEQELLRARRALERALASERRSLRADGRTPPALPAALTHLDDGRPS